MACPLKWHWLPTKCLSVQLPYLRRNNPTMRLHLFEFEDFSWFPDVIRVGGMDYLRYLLIVTELYKPLVPLISDALLKSKHETIVDLCAGGGGYTEQVYDEINAHRIKKVKFLLTDKFPNLAAFRLLKAKTNGDIDFVEKSVDATQVPNEIKGFRAMFSAVHHFKPEQVKAMLQDAVDNNAAISLFDGGDKNLVSILGILLLHPLVFLFGTPFFKPFKFSRLFFTYILPLIPLYTMWDGLVSVLRFYQPAELLKIAKSTNAAHYTWRHGKTRSKFGLHATYLIGYPVFLPKL
jgi:hypothetical protein